MTRIIKPNRIMIKTLCLGSEVYNLNMIALDEDVLEFLSLQNQDF